MDDLQALQKIQKLLKADLESVSTVLISGGVDKIDNYKYLVGQAFTIKRTLQEISNLLQPKEQKNEQGTVIDIGDARIRPNTKN
jgi:hypothetical protein|tara:strand:+ start:592 stop:843 length:252 start_codon:yes stop_codon:yes gene_type:complete